MVGEFKNRYKTFKNWWRFIPPLNRWQYDVVARLRLGPKILINNIRSVDYATVVAVAGNDSYCLSQIKNPNIVVDVGAHIGIFSLIMAERYPQATIYAIEPDKENYLQLVNNIARNGYKNIVPMNVAIGKDFGSTIFYKTNSSVAHSIIAPEGESTAITVETIPLHKFNTIDVLKFDAEGAEYFIGNIPKASYIAIEVHNLSGKNKDALMKQIKDTYTIVKEEVEKTGHVTLVGIC